MWWRGRCCPGTAWGSRRLAPPAAAAPPAHGRSLPRLPSPFPSDASGNPVFDCVVLGVGPDGHVASLFPNRPELAAAGRWVLPVSASPKPPPERITLSMPAINAAKEVMIVVTGEGKAEIVTRVLEVRARGAGRRAPRPGLQRQGSRPWDGPRRRGGGAARGLALSLGRTRVPLVLACSFACTPDRLPPRHPPSLPPQCQSLPGALPAQLVRPGAGRARWVLDAFAAQGLNVGEWEAAKDFPRNL